jgi:nucleoside-diphosphate-sugar epimerase
MGLKLFITGASGYLGSVLATQLAVMPEVESITGTVNTSRPSSPLPENVKLIKIDIRSPELVDVMAGHDVVLHTAFVVLWLENMPEAVRDDINFNGTRNVAQAAVKRGVSKFIHASSLAAYDPLYAQGKRKISEDSPIGNGTSPMYYWNSKALTETLLRDIIEPTDTLLTLYRIPYIIGPNNRTTVPEFRKNAAKFPGFDPVINFVHEDDVCSAYERAIRSERPGAYNVVPDDSIKASELFELLDVKPLIVPYWLAYFVTYIRWKFFGSKTHPSWVRSQIVDFSASNAKLKATGWTPQYSCADAIRTAL